MTFTVGGENDVQTLIVPICSDDIEEMGATRLPSWLQAYSLLPHMGERGALTWLHGRIGERHALLVGCGEASRLDTERIREAAGSAGRAIHKHKKARVGINLGELLKRCEHSVVISEAEAVTAWVEGWKLGTYAFEVYRTKQTQQAEVSLQFLAETEADVVKEEEARFEVLNEAVRWGCIYAEGAILARNLVNEPPNILRPKTLIEKTMEHFAHTKVEAVVYEGERLEQHGMVGLIAVGKGSKYPPALLELRYCTDEALPLTALIGKGITFDTGGISLKKDFDISDMRMDMAGAAAVIGALDILAVGDVRANVVVLIAAAENMPDGEALLPGEVLQYPNGVSVQVGNTDSEGRLVLADALLHAHRLGAVEAVDIATLTYSCGAALGSKYAGIWGEDTMVAEIVQAGKQVSEKVWQLPLVDEYEAYLHSDYADICNISRVGEAGATTAALFLRKFVQPSLRWAHIDMASLKDVSSAQGWHSAGATGYGARLLAQFVRNRVSNENVISQGDSRLL
ncbi:leucyl aminopeptidase family protein [Paenibacillus alginolyticus]|uniref:Probable cytosol aminopeptidase n=1 Tax=Paenibacillus alginolyticus TaxID=59839 RepID=A0ABT4GM66_9BACL|nr:leucyl aminopeptidase family protein [Paenibacillus alginolyticus]MCY9697303.1 leucyl aminopeptidase family protein [Paenibacillus alginolyticus]MEC0145192.1 leucyl aminopeptidase family protein [Paenibacillus alginolyticus]